MTHDNESKQSVEDRRRYFRIDDSIHLSFRRIQPEELPRRLELARTALPNEFTLMSTLAAMSQEIMARMRRVEASNPDVGACLRALDKKIEVLGRAFLAQSENLADRPMLPVNISASGIAVFSSERVDPGALLELKMLLMPSLTGIITFGEVIACDKRDARDAQYPYLLRVDFCHMQGSDREVLISHMLRRQGDIIRREKDEAADRP